MNDVICIGSVAFTSQEARDAASMHAAGLSHATIARRLQGCEPWHIGQLLEAAGFTISSAWCGQPPTPQPFTRRTNKQTPNRQRGFFFDE